MATGVLMMNPPGATTSIRKSAYALPPASLTWKDLSFSLPPKRASLKELFNRRNNSSSKGNEPSTDDGGPRTILEPCSGHYEADDLVALMGPSGCGKTTLLDMLAMKKTTKYEGEVLVNGRPRDRLFRRIAAYVGQDELMPAHWKVKEAIKFSATLKRQPVRSHEKLGGWIEVLLETFGLTSVADSLIGSQEVRGISGGQRRRVTLARGVAAHASLLFCDEPTSGLSATDAELCIRALRTVAKRLGVMCMVVIHQPRNEVAMLFDHLILLTSHPGRVAYCGPMAQATHYLAEQGHPVPANINVTDYFMDILTPGTRQDRSDELVAIYRQVQKPRVDAMVDEAWQVQGLTVPEMLGIESSSCCYTTGPYCVSFLKQLACLLRRKVMITLRNPLALGLPLLVPVIQGIIVGYMFEGIGKKELLRQVMFVFCLLTMLCLAGSMSLIVLITERTLMKHETSEALYSEGASSLATLLVDVPLALLGAVLNILIMTWFAKLDPEIFSMVFAWAVLLFFVYDSLFAFIGAVAADVRQAQTIATPFISIFMLFNGFVVSKRDSPEILHWIFYVSPNAYAMQAIVVKMASGAGWEGQMLLEQFGYEDSEGQSQKGMEVLIGMIVAFRVVQQFGLVFLNGITR